MESYKSKMIIFFATIFPLRPKASTKENRDTILAGLTVNVSESNTGNETLTENELIDNEYVLSAEYLQEEAYHGSSISHNFAQILLWSYLSILITPILLTLSHFRSSKYFSIAATSVIFAIVILITHFHHDDKKLERNYITAWDTKNEAVKQETNDRVYPKYRDTKFRTSHLAQINHLQSIPENQQPQSLSHMRHEMGEKYTAAMKDMTSETRVMLNIYLITSGAISMAFLWVAYYLYHHPTYIYEATSYMLLVIKCIVVMVMAMHTWVLHQTKFWMEELERERRSIMRGWNIVY